jgi:FMN phosphatase YigB (HAD superfamily)
MNMLVSASAVASASVVPSAASGSTGLSELFAEMWRAFEIEREADKRFDEQIAIRNELVQANQNWPDNQALWTRDDAKAYWEELKKVSARTDIAAAETAYVAAAERVDGICKQIIERYPATVQGIAAQALLAARANPRLWQHDDYENVQLHALFNAVFAAAGVECPFKFELPTLIN